LKVLQPSLSFAGRGPAEVMVLVVFNHGGEEPLTAFREV
jgi:hypothetical protein